MDYLAGSLAWPDGENGVAIYANLARMRVLWGSGIAIHVY